MGIGTAGQGQGPMFASLTCSKKPNSEEREPRQVDPQNSVDNRINEGYTVSPRIKLRTSQRDT